MLVFMDESGHPHPHDSSTRPVLVAVCVEDSAARRINTELYRLKKDILGREQDEFEAKAVQLITRSTFRNSPEKREFVESFFDRCRDLPFTLFAVVMERPINVVAGTSTFLPMQFRWLLYRVNEMLRGTPNFATVLFDGDGSQYNGISLRFSNFFYRSRGGQALTSLTETPFFVDSKITPGIQIADMFASVIRQYHEKELYRRLPPGDSFLSAISRYYKVATEKTMDITTQDDQTWYGISRMAERFHHFGDESEPNPEPPEDAKTSP